MATKTANVMARVEPEIKEQAEAVMTRLGIPASVVINMLYKQIIMTQSIPFSLAIPAPLSLEEIDRATLDAFLQQGMDEAAAGKGRPAKEVFADLRERYSLHG